MYTRLSVSVVISLLLHAVVVVAFMQMYGRSPDRDQRRPASGPMVVQFAPAKPATPSGNGGKREKSAKPDVPRAAPPQAAAAKQLSTPFSSRSGFAPQPYQQMQVEIQRMDAARARQFTSQQQQMTLINLQGRIAQALRLAGWKSDGSCGWDNGSAGEENKAHCEPDGLAQALRDETATLASLRQLLRTQGQMLEGFSVTAGDTAPVIEYHIGTP